MLTLIDNYDSFTYNLVHFLGELGASTRVYRNDQVSVDEVLAEAPEAIVLSPGPCDPDRAGICLDLIARAGGNVPILGVCLGHQAIGQVYGGHVVRAPVLMHGKLSKVHHANKGVFAGLPQDFSATRYHSLVVERETLPEDLEITAETADGIIMGVQHKHHPVHGVQFHPESIASEHGHQLLANFLDLARVGRSARAPAQRTRHVSSNSALADAPARADLGAALRKVAAGQSLTQSEATDAFELIVSGEASDAQVGGLLMALRMRGETVEEIAGAAKALRARAVSVKAPEGAIDTCGTGGDAKGTQNISTCAAFVVAGAGVPVAKHGNRSISSRSGSADVLAALGVNIECAPELVARCIQECGLGFMFAPAHHAAMRQVAHVRSALGTRTIFNLLGPLANPANTKYQIVGVYAESWVEPIANVLGLLGVERAWVVHGSDGLDELTTTGISHVAAIDGGRVSTFRISPKNAGLPEAKPGDLAGGDANENAAHLRAVLQGNRSPLRDVVLLNAGAALLVAGKAQSLRDGVGFAAESIDSGKASRVLEALVALSHDKV